MLAHPVAARHVANRWSLSSTSSSADSSDAESHKNEGFLKSMWHTLTNHPAHQKDAGAESGKGKEDDKSKGPSEGSSKKNEDPKKSGDSNSS